MLVLLVGSETGALAHCSGSPPAAGIVTAAKEGGDG